MLLLQLINFSEKMNHQTENPIVIVVKMVIKIAFYRDAGTANQTRVCSHVPNKSNRGLISPVKTGGTTHQFYRVTTLTRPRTDNYHPVNPSFWHMAIDFWPPPPFRNVELRHETKNQINCVYHQSGFRNNVPPCFMILSNGNKIADNASCAPFEFPLMGFTSTNQFKFRSDFSK